MKKKIISRSLLGAPLGIAIGYVITVLISVCVGNGAYYSVSPVLTEMFGNELNAVIIQMLCCALYGAVFAGSSAIWEIESWSILRMTLTHLIVISISSLPISWFMNWIPHTLWGVLSYFAIFYGIYAIIWLCQYSGMKKKVKQMNDKIKNSAQE